MNRIRRFLRTTLDFAARFRRAEAAELLTMGSIRARISSLAISPPQSLWNYVFPYMSELGQILYGGRQIRVSTGGSSFDPFIPRPSSRNSDQNQYYWLSTNAVD
jgi:hypothetical protein